MRAATAKSKFTPLPTANVGGKVTVASDMMKAAAGLYKEALGMPGMPQMPGAGGMPGMPQSPLQKNKQWQQQPGAPRPMTPGPQRSGLMPQTGQMPPAPMPPQQPQQQPQQQPPQDMQAYFKRMGGVQAGLGPIPTKPSNDPADASYPEGQRRSYGQEFQKTYGPAMQGGKDAYMGASDFVGNKVYQAGKGLYDAGQSAGRGYMGASEDAGDMAYQAGKGIHDAGRFTGDVAQTTASGVRSGIGTGADIARSAGSIAKDKATRGYEQATAPSRSIGTWYGESVSDTPEEMNAPPEGMSEQDQMMQRARGLPADQQTAMGIREGGPLTTGDRVFGQAQGAMPNDAQQFAGGSMGVGPPQSPPGVPMGEYAATPGPSAQPQGATPDMNRANPQNDPFMPSPDSGMSADAGPAGPAGASRAGPAAGPDASWRYFALGRSPIQAGEDMLAGAGPLDMEPQQPQVPAEFADIANWGPGSTSDGAGINAAGQNVYEPPAGQNPIDAMAAGAPAPDDWSSAREAFGMDPAGPGPGDPGLAGAPKDDGMSAADALASWDAKTKEGPGGLTGSTSDTAAGPGVAGPEGADKEKKVPSYKDNKHYQHLKGLEGGSENWRRNQEVERRIRQYEEGTTPVPQGQKDKAQAAMDRGDYRMAAYHSGALPGPDGQQMQGSFDRHKDNMLSQGRMWGGNEQRDSRPMHTVPTG